MHCYFLTSLSKEIKILNTLDKIENNSIFTQILNPRKARQRINFNPTDKFLGKMEIWIQEAEKNKKITPSESELILKYSPFYKEKLVIFNGMVRYIRLNTFSLAAEKHLPPSPLLQ